jgi:hypothetical protein
MARADIDFATTIRRPRRITPQLSGRALPYEARRERIMKWRARPLPRRRVTVRCNCLLCNPAYNWLTPLSIRQQTEYKTNGRNH